MSDSYKIDIAGDFYVRKFYGEIYLNTIQNSWIELMALDNYLMYKGFLTDFCAARVIITKNDLDDIISFYKSNSIYLTNKRNAVISLQPSMIAFIMLLKMNLNCLDIRYCLKPFSTYEAALHWLKKH
ncbi:hypothetical protein L21SP5_03185 [Salinivirga cyanobacteriivorans]|uniref:SpoIIAA-like protein n=1 Tax=Salinivirga cyanobacteriivorans TaxID=1307839 RepID=A0A0S2I3G0_9BACT|nr:hypothetical protein [Salinivirga cyanobacteriivorans]ALO16800.1 hypothetical protein L21SP5_03185 [Salinivirga cyanobacteriivorans]